MAYTSSDPRSRLATAAAAPPAAYGTTSYAKFYEIGRASCRERV